MGRVLPACVLLVLGYLLCVVSIGLSAPGQAGQGRSTTLNGDVNGDGERNLSDAVHLLLYLFREGEPPAALADTPEFLARVAALEAAVERLSRPCDADTRFVDNGDGTVTDTCTGLTWLDDYADLNGERVGAVGNWHAAQAHAEILDLGGHADWRLPRVEEFDTLAHEVGHFQDFRAMTPFKFSGAPIFWTADCYSPDTSTACYVDLSGISYGVALARRAEDALYGIAVRGPD
jgi:hypothetical protein